MNLIAKKVLVLAISAVVAVPVWAAALQDPAPSPKRVSMLGTIAAIDGNSLTLKTDAGALAAVVAGEDTRIVETLPGQKDLSTATPIHITDLQVGDRVLAKGLPAEDGKSYAATLIVAIKQGDIAQKQQHERDEWQGHGIGGLVKAVDPPSGTVTISSTTLGATHLTVVHTGPTTVLRRYAPDSIEFNAAAPAPLAAIQPGDQLRARGTSNIGGELDADEIVSGTFRNVVATVTTIDAASGTITAKDLVTKMAVVVRVAPDSQLRKLPPMMAMGIAMRMKGGAAPSGSGGPEGGTGHGWAPPQGSNGGSSARSGGGPGAGPGAAAAPAGPPGEAGNAAPGEHPRGTGDLQQALSRAPGIKLTDLNKGDAIMVVTTEGSATTPATVVTLLAGVEPMFQASASGSQSMLQSSWNLTGGGGDVPQ